jgi:hypothetical protein
MKNKIVTCIVLAAIILFVSVASAMAQAKSTFAGDININPESGKEYGFARVSVAYNGDVYVGRLVRVPGDDYKGWQILKSTDGGITFTDITGTIATPIDVHYTAFDMMACGNSEADFKLVLAIGRFNNSNAEARIGLGWYNSQGVMGGIALQSAIFTSPSPRGWASVALSSDTKSPTSQSTPYSISLVAAKAWSQDSVIVWTGNDGGASFTRRALASTPGYIRNVSCATGIINGSTYGRLGIVWDEYSSATEEWGNVKARFIWADDASDMANGGPYDVGTNANEYKTPVISMAIDENLTDHKGCITYVYNGSGDDINTRTFDQLMNGQPQITGGYSSLTVADGAGDQLNPHTSYNPADNKFLFTYYNAANDALVYKAADFSDITIAPALAQLNYRDNQDAMTDPMPRVDGLTSARNFFVWTDQFNTFIDMEIRWPASVQNTSVSVADMKLYPNPATDNITLSFTAEENDKAMVSIIDMSGRILQNTEATITKGSNKLPITFNNLPAGNYTLRMSGEHTNTAVMFTVQH